MGKITLEEANTCEVCGHDHECHRSSNCLWKGKENTQHLVPEAILHYAKTEKEKKEVVLKHLKDKTAESENEKRKLFHELQDALMQFEELGLPDAYLRLLRTQSAVLQERIEANPDDRTAKEMLERVSGMLNNVERSVDVTCCICMEMPVGVRFNPCGHECVCMSCSMQVGTCPLCRSRIVSSATFSDSATD